MSRQQEHLTCLEDFILFRVLK